MVRTINCLEETTITTTLKPTTFTFDGCEWSECVEVKNNKPDEDLCKETCKVQCEKCKECKECKECKDAKHGKNTGCFPSGKFAIGSQSICCKPSTTTTATTKSP